MAVHINSCNNHSIFAEQMSKYVVGEYPLEFSSSGDKKHTNQIISDIFAQQGLSRQFRRSAVVLILDTCELLTTFTLLKNHRGKLKRIIIVEKDCARYAAIMLMVALKSGTYKKKSCPMINVVNANVFDFLRTTKQKIDFMWLDLMTEQIRESEFDAIMSSLRNVRCAAFTISARSRNKLSVSKRVATMAKHFCQVLPHLALSYGYNSCWDDGRPGQPMHVAAFGRVDVECMFRFTNVVEHPKKPGWVIVTWAGYPKEKDKTEWHGTVAEWLKSTE